MTVIDALLAVVLGIVGSALAIVGAAWASYLPWRRR